MTKLQTLSTALLIGTSGYAEGTMSTYSLEEITVSASVEDNLTQQELPFQIDKITPELAGTGSLGKVLSELAGVNTISTGPQAGNVVIRGLSGERIKVLSNDMVQDFQGYGNRHIPNVDPSLSEGIEVIRGAAGVLYGSNAMGGVVNLLSPTFLTPQEGEEAFEGELGYAYHTNNNENDLVLKTKTAYGKWGVNIAASKKKADNFTTGKSDTWKKAENNDLPLFAGELPFTDFDTESVKAALGYSGEETKVSLEHTYWNALQNYLGHTPAPSFSALPTGQDLSNNETVLNIVQNIGAEWQVSAKAAHLENDRKALTGGTYEAIPTNTASAGYVHLNTQRDSTRITLKHPYVFGFVGEIGFDGYNKDQNLLAGKLAPSAVEEGRGIFLFEEGEFDKWVVQAGLRYDQQEIDAPLDGTNSYFVSQGIFNDSNNQRDFSALSGSIGASYALSEHYTLASNLSQGFRAPSIFELYAGGIHGGVQAFQLGNPNLNEETNTGIDLSLRYVNETAKSNLTAYYNSIDDYIYIENTGNMINGLVEMKHAQTDASIYGIEWECAYMIYEDTTLRANAELLWGRDTKNDTRLTYMPPKNFSLGVTQGLGNTDWLKDNTLTLDMPYFHKQSVASHYEQFTQYNFTPFGSADTSSYVLFDMGVHSTVTLFKKELKLEIQATNLFDRAYRAYLDTYKGYALSQGRDISFSVTMPF